MATAPALTSATAPPAAMAELPDLPLRVMVVDDSAVIRGLIVRTLEAEADLKVVASVADGRLAVSALERHLVDVIVLDIEMPNLDGLSAIPLLLAIAPQVRIIMASTLTLQGADISLRALTAGAADYIPKPTAARDLMGAATFNRDLVAKVRPLAIAARRAGSRIRGGVASARPQPRPVAPPVLAAVRPASTRRPRVLAIGSSTGGPQALFKVVKHLGGLSQPILITQHMPPFFTGVLANHISSQCGVTAVEGQAGMRLTQGQVYIAPGDYHMTVRDAGDGGPPVLALDQGPQENFCRPAVDPMLRSLVKMFGADVLTAILTGMGHDGLQGCRGVVTAGGTVLAQDEATSVVWGMPGAVAQAGLCAAILPVDDIGPRLRRAALAQS
jgi:two-component system chemotaxis response regulator CheB